MYVIPPQGNRRHFQENKNPISGTIFVSKNIDLTSEYSIKLSPKAVAFYTENDDVEFRNLDAMNVGDGEIIVLGDEVFTGKVDDSGLDSRAADTNRPTPGLDDDVVFFNSTLVVSDGTAVDYESAGGVWTTLTGLSTVSSQPTPLAVFEGQNALLVGSGNKVDLVNTSWSVVRTLTIPSDFVVTSMATNGSVAYIGTRHDGNGEAKIFLWDGNTTSANASYGAGTYELSSVRVYGSSVACFAADGRLLRFNGGGFDTLAAWPVYFSRLGFGDASGEYANVTNRGMVVEGDDIFINMTAELSHVTDNMPYFPSGIWRYNPRVGLYHYASPSMTRLVKKSIDISTKVNISTNTITATDVPVTGTPCQYFSGGNAYIGGLLEITTYYVIRLSSTTFKLAASYRDALAGNEIDLTSTAGSLQFQDFYWFEPVDYGHTYIDVPRGAIAVLNNEHYDSIFAMKYAFTADIESVAASEVSVLNSFNLLLPNRGYFITPQLYSQTKEDEFGRIDIKHSTLGVDDKIIIKYRVKTFRKYPTNFNSQTLEDPSDYHGTWTSTTTFTTKRDMSNISAGDEVEIVAGDGAGYIAHISSLSESSGTWTVTLDEAVITATATQTFRYVIDNWKRLTTITSDSEESGARIDDHGKFIQFKIEMRGVDVEIYEIMVDNQPHKIMV